MAKRKTNSTSSAKNASGAKNANGKKQASALEKARRQSVATSAKRKQERGSQKSFWKGVRHEMSKVVWPTKKELATYTVVVIATCAVFALGFWVIDTGVLAVMKYVLGIALS